MRKKITAIIVDEGYKYHNYREVKYDDGGKYSEKSFELMITDTGKGISKILYEKRGFDAIITIGSKESWVDLLYMPFFIRKKWVHFDEFDPKRIASAIISTFKTNTLEREDAPALFSFFTCTHCSDAKKIKRLYDSMRNQTYNEWDWFIIDDSPNDTVEKIINDLQDVRITLVKNATMDGNIGMNKHMAAMMCDGDFLLEVDHDDELTPDCLETILNANKAFPNTDFFYSLCLEMKHPEYVPIIYGKGWGWGEGLTKTEAVNGVKYTFSATPGINPFSIRTIYAQPNHIRVWKRDFYHKIGGHNVNYSVLDDQELIVRTFLHGEMTKIDKVLYIQHEEGERIDGDSNTQSVRFAEIQRTAFLLLETYDKKIHDRILELNFNDTAWDPVHQRSDLGKQHEPGQETMSNLYIP